MKKLLFILLACFISVSVVALGNAQDVCEGLEGSAYDLCGAYCEAQDCDSPDVIKRSCLMLKKNFAKHTGTDVMPCDIVACALCSDAVGAGTVGECEEIPAFECAAIEGALDMGEYACDEVIIPAASENYNSCLIFESPNPFNVHPLCQNSIPDFVCRIFIKGEVLPPNSCPAPPSCLE
jgi:hypothetical protein